MTSAQVNDAEDRLGLFFEALRFSILPELKNDSAALDRMTTSFIENAREQGLGNYTPDYVRGVIEASFMLIISENAVKTLLLIESDISKYHGAIILEPGVA